MPERLEDLQRPFVNDRRPIPAERRVELVDQQARHVASLQLGRQQQPGRPGADHEHLRARIAHLNIHAAGYCRGASDVVITADVLGIVPLVVWVRAAAWSARTGGMHGDDSMRAASWRIWPLGALGIGYLVP